MNKHQKKSINKLIYLPITFRLRNDPKTSDSEYHVKYNKYLTKFYIQEIVTFRTVLICTVIASGGLIFSYDNVSLDGIVLVPL